MTIFAKRHRASSKPRRRGAVTVETALVLPLVLIFLFGILEYGRYMMMLQVLTNAAREGAHYAVTHSQPITISGVTKGNATSDVTAAVNKALAGQQLTGQTIQVYTSNATGASNLGAWTNAQFGQSICVRIDGNYSVMIASMLRMPATIPVTARVVMRSESN